MLFGACLTKLFTNESTRLFTHRSRRLGEDWEVQSQEEWSRQAQARLHAPPARMPELAGFDLLIECCRPEEFQRVTITQLARTSMRLLDTPNARAWIVFDQRLQCSYDHAIQLAEQLLSEHTPPATAAAVLEYRASAFASIGEYQRAAQDAHWAFKSDERKVSALVNWMHYAIMAGDAPQAREAGRILDATVSIPSHAVLEQLSTYHQLWRRGFTPHEESMRRAARQIDQAAGPLSRKVLDVYL